MYAQDSPIFEDQSQRKHFYEHLTAFSNYTSDNHLLAKHYILADVYGEAFYANLLNSRSQKIKELLKLNQTFINHLIPFQPTSVQLNTLQTTQMNMTKLRSTLKQFYREWCEESTQKELFVRLVGQLKGFKTKGRVLLPGCGLGRIVLEFVKAGFAAQGNEVSYFMLLGSDYILNTVSERNSITLAPFIHSFDYNLNNNTVFKTIRIPDSLACEDVPENSDFSMTSGDFLDVYGKQQEEWDAIVTCFFMDTANNILRYVDLIQKLLKPSGIWINYGPLLYHHRDQPNQTSIELSWQSLRKYILHKKLTILSEQTDEATYCHMPGSMCESKFNCIYFTVQKG